LNLEEIQSVKKPSWLKVKFPSDSNFFRVSHILKKERLHTICQSAKCPNISECWSKRTATFLILGDICTRDCAFCAVKKGSPHPPSLDEPRQVAEAVARLGLRYAVVTSVTRDDLADGGAFLFAETIEALKERMPGIKVEVLIPDEPGYPRIRRPAENYKRSLQILKKAREKGAVTKSGLMVGLGETREEILQSFSDLRDASCELLTIGQYLQPTRAHAPVREFYSPSKFKELKDTAFDFGFRGVESGPLVRSSYMAHRMYNSFKEKAL